MNWNEDIFPWLRYYRHYIFLIFAAIALRLLIVALYRKRKKLKKKDNFIIGINNVTLVVGLIWLFMFVLNLLGITIREFFTSITIIAAALAIVFRDYIVNGLNGMIMMFGDNYRIGDYIEIGDNKGIIEDLTLMSVHLKNDEDNTVIIPNNHIASSVVINYSKNPRHFSTVDFELTTVHSINPERLEQAMDKALKPYEAILREDSQQLKVVEYKTDIIHYRMRFGLKKYEHSISREIKQELYRELLELIEVDKKKN
ncbi:MAG: mechanosensitive ion channel [Bacteroidetes bacterium]|nr:mechanosensitive ion channel [Bacteroidota bacterium]